MAQATQSVAVEEPSVTEPSSPPGEALPRRLGAFELLERIGQGGMGVVYKARQISLERDVAVKVLSLAALGNQEAVNRFRTEAVTAGSLMHPNIVAVHEVGLAEGQHYLVMDYVPGPTLADISRNGPLPARRAAQYLRTIAEAVHFAHERGILHRDLKPSNVLIDPNDQSRVTDFGLAKRLDTGSEFTLSGQVLGSPAFIPPEQASGQRGHIGRRSDVYALGAILYQLLTGRPPFVGEALTDILHQVVHQDPLRPRLLNPAVPKDIETVCQKCLEKEPAQRYSTAESLAEELGRFLEGKPVVARPISLAGKVWRWCRRNPRLAALTGVALSSLLLGLAGVTWQWRRAEVEALLARRNAYAADMNLVQQALDDDKLSSAREQLKRHQPIEKSTIHNPQSAMNLRGWEWRYLWAQCRGEERSIMHQFTNAIWALAFSPDGKWLAVGQENGAVALWDAVTRQPVTELPVAGRYVRYKALDFSPEGRFLAWGSREDSGAAFVTLWDLTAQKEMARFPHSSNLVVSLAFAPDARWLATLAEDGALRIWDVASNQVLTNIATAPLAYSPADRFLDRFAPATSAAEPIAGLAGTYPPILRQPAKASKRGPGYTAHAGCVHFSPDGRWLAVGAMKPEIRLWDWPACREEKSLVLPEAADCINSLAFSRDSRWLAAACGSDYKILHVWELATRAESRLEGHQDWIAGLAFAPDRPTLASVSADQTLRLWDVVGQAQLGRFQGNTNEVWAVAWSREGKNLLTGARDGTVRCWDSAGKTRRPYETLPAAVWGYGLIFLPDSRQFLTIGRGEGHVVRWDTATLRPLETLSFLGTGYSCGALSKDGRWLALGVTNGPVRIWDLPARQCVTNLGFRNAGLIIGILLSPGGRYLYCGAYQSTPNWRVTNQTWEVPSWREVNVRGVDFANGEGFDLAPDDRTVAKGYWNGTAAWWDILTGKRLAFFDCHYSGGALVRFSPDGRWFATAGRDGRITLWDAVSRPPALTHDGLGYGSLLHGLVFSPDGRRLITTGTSPRGLAKVWDVATGRDVLTLPGEPGFFARVDFSPDGNTLFAINLQGGTVVWRAPSWEEIEKNEPSRRRP